MKRISWLAAGLTTALLLGTLAPPQRANAAGGELKSPDLAIPADYPRSSFQELTRVLNRPDCKFLGGFWLNQHTTLKYGGDAEALNLFVDGLTKLPGLAVSVRFYRPEPGEAAEDWMLTQLGMNLAVRINLASPRLKLEDLRFPEFSNPPRPAAPAVKGPEPGK